MARDYKKPRGGRKRKKDESTSPWRFLLGGFSMGVIAAAIVYYMLSPSAPRRPDEPIAETRRPPASVAAEASADTPPALEPTPDPVAQSDDEQTEPEEKGYAFWNMLKDYEVILPEEPAQLEDAKPPAPISKPGRYLLQVGSFRSYADADRLKARLALQGIECSIKRITLDDNQYHRVLIGPENELSAVNALRDRLKRQDIKYLVIRIPAD